MTRSWGWCGRPRSIEKGEEPGSLSRSVRSQELPGWRSVGIGSRSSARTGTSSCGISIKSAEEFDTVPISYSRSLAWLKFCMVKAVELTVEKGHLEQVVANELAAGIQGVSWHSMRVTLLIGGLALSLMPRNSNCHLTPRSSGLPTTWLG